MVQNTEQKIIYIGFPMVVLWFSYGFPIHWRSPFSGNSPNRCLCRLPQPEISADSPWSDPRLDPPVVTMAFKAQNGPRMSAWWLGWFGGYPQTDNKFIELQPPHIPNHDTSQHFQRVKKTGPGSGDTCWHPSCGAVVPKDLGGLPFGKFS